MIYDFINKQTSSKMKKHGKYRKLMEKIDVMRPKDLQTKLNHFTSNMA